MYEVVLDTNVLVTALRSRRGASFQLIRRVGQGEFRMNISVALALEYEEVLKRADLIPEFSEAEIDTFLHYIFKVSNLVPSVVPLRPNLPDPDDELVLDLAAQRHAMILTYNRRDFGEAKRLGIHVLSPLEFLGILRHEI
jgi:putative PIN family toxin of toxin-antitoxin system